MLASTARISEVLIQEESTTGMNISIHIDGEGKQTSSSYTIEKNESAGSEGERDFDKSWDFDPAKKGTQRQEKIQEELDKRGANLNPILNIIHNFLLLVLFMVSTVYLLGSLFNDRRDRSILFWHSMPVSEWEEVLSKFFVVMVVAPMVYICVSVLLQLSYVLVAMLWVWRMDMEPFQLIVGNIDFVSLWFNQLAGWILTAVWLAPVYAWLLVASAGSRRSPFILAIAPVIGLVLVERIFLGSDLLVTTLSNHVPHYDKDVGALGFYMNGPDWASVNYLDGLLGVLFTAAALTAAVHLRRYRFDT